MADDAARARQRLGANPMTLVRETLARLAAIRPPRTEGYSLWVGIQIQDVVQMHPRSNNLLEFGNPLVKLRCQVGVSRSQDLRGFRQRIAEVRVQTQLT